MQIPLQMTFHQLDPSPALEADIRQRVDKLQRFFDRLISCRVSIEAPHRHRHQGRLYRVHIEIGVPGDHIVVARSPDQHAAHVDPYVAVRDAFREAKRQLEDHAQRVRGEVKAHGAATGRATPGGRGP